MSISIIYNTSTESNVMQEFSTATELKNFISTNKANFTGTMKVVCDNSITNCSRMFENCINITNLDLSNFDTSQVTSMNAMFDSCSSLTNLDVSNFNTSNVTNMGYMFSGCSSLTNLDVNGFDTGKVERTEDMFRYCSNLETIYCEQDWKSNQITNSSDMFANCTKLKGAIPYDSAKIDINYANPDTGYFSYLPSRKFLVNLNMDQNEIKNMLLDKRNTAPDLPAAGQIYYNTTDKKIYIYNGTEWIAGSGFKSSLSLVEAQPYESPEVI